MKKQLLLIALTINSAFSFTQNSNETLKIDTSKSELKWTGEYAFYFGGHQGTVEFKEGYFLKNNGVIIGGEFILDMNSIVSTDNGKIDKNSGLVKHLKNQDFFEVDKFPLAKLEITGVSYNDETSIKIFANLTIKEITLPIDFRAEVDYEKEQLTTKFKIDRTRWNINYNSKEIEGKLKDGLISDAIGFEVKLNL